MTSDNNEIFFFHFHTLLKIKTLESTNLMTVSYFYAFLLFKKILKQSFLFYIPIPVPSPSLLLLPAPFPQPPSHPLLRESKVSHGESTKSVISH